MHGCLELDMPRCLIRWDPAGPLSEAKSEAESNLRIAMIGVRDLVACGYSIPGRMRQRGCGRAPAFRVARCRTQSGVSLDGLGWVPLGPVKVRQGPVCVRISQSYTDTEQSSDLSGSSGPVRPYRVPTRFRGNPVWARRDRTRLDGSLNCPAPVND